MSLPLSPSVSRRGRGGPLTKEMQMATGPSGGVEMGNDVPGRLGEKPEPVLMASFPSGLKPRIVSRLEQHCEVCTKTRLALNTRMSAERLRIPCSWVPETHVVTGGKGTGDFSKLATAFKRLAASRGTVWIVKPGFRNRGNGIVVMNSLEDIEKHLANQKLSWVVQKYIESPILLDGRKFDIRSFVVVTPEGDVYMHKDSYVRTSSTAFTLEDLTDRAIHLTNDAVQKDMPHYGTFEENNKLSMAQLQTALGDQVDIEGDIVPKMWECARHVFKAVQGKLAPAARQPSFELFGLDFMIDTNCQVYLIEVNTCPALYRCCPLLSELLPRVVEEAIQKALDPHFPAPTGATQPERLDGFQILLPRALPPPAGTKRRLTHSSSLGSSFGSFGRDSRRTSMLNT